MQKLLNSSSFGILLRCYMYLNGSITFLSTYFASMRAHFSLFLLQKVYLKLRSVTAIWSIGHRAQAESQNLKSRIKTLLSFSYKFIKVRQQLTWKNI